MSLRAYSKVFLKAFVSTGLLFFLFSMVDWIQVSPVLFSAQISPALFALAIFPLLIYLSILKWDSLLRIHHIHVGQRRLFRYYWIAFFASNFFPSNIGGDVTRLAFLRKEGSLFAVGASIFMERLTGVSLLLALAFIALLVRPEYVDGYGVLGVLLPLVVALLASIACFFWGGDLLSRLLKKLAQSPNKLKRGFFEGLGKILDTIIAYRKSPETLLFCLGLSLLFYMFRVLQQYFMLLALGLDAPFTAVFCIALLIDLVWALPVSLNGLGVVEGTFVLFYTQAGLLPAEALALGLFWRFLHLLASAPGGIFWAGERSSTVGIRG